MHVHVFPLKRSRSTVIRLIKLRSELLSDLSVCVLLHILVTVNSPQLQSPACPATKFFTLVLCFLLMAGDAGWPGLGMPLEAADPVPEWRRAERSSADSTPRPPDPIPEPTIPGACCWDTFCSSAANCLGSTPGERCPPAQTNCFADGHYTSGARLRPLTHTCIKKKGAKTWTVHTSLKLEMVLQGLWMLGVRQHIQVTVWIHMQADDYLSTSMIIQQSVTVLFVR